MTRHSRRPTSDMSAPTTIPDELADANPSTKLIWQTLAVDDDELTQYQLKDRTALAHATVSKALSELESRGLVGSRPQVRNPSQYLYYRTGRC